MTKLKKIKKTKEHYKTAAEMEEEQSRTLYIRLPKTIKNVDEINELFIGSFEVKLPRQSGRYCHVIFSDLKEKFKNLKAIRSKRINGRRIFTAPPRPIGLEKKKSSQHKKIKMDEPMDEPSGAAKYLFVSNIAPGVKASELKNAFSGAMTVALLKGLIKGTRTAKIKMPLSQCLHYLKNKSELPTFKGKKVKVKFSKKTKGDNKKTQKKTKLLEICNSESDSQDFSQSTKKSNKLSNKVEIDNKSSDESITENEENITESHEESEDEVKEEEDSE